MMFEINVAGLWLHDVAVIMNCKHGSLHFVYLGLPIGGDPRKFQFWYPLVDRNRGRLPGSKSKTLS